jgi:hypothetical protein
MPDLPDADELHRRFFDPWYKAADRKRKGYPATRPDVLYVAGFRNVPWEELSPLQPDRQRAVLAMIERMVSAARRDWESLTAPHDVLSRDGLMALHAGLDDDRLGHLIESSDPNDIGNSYFVTACELGAVVGAALKAARTTLKWVPDWPYWESSLVDRKTGHVIAPFHWAIKRMSATARDFGLVEKIAACLELLRAEKSGERA